MKQLGNLAIVCANRPEVLMQLHDKQVCVHVGAGPDRTYSAPRGTMMKELTRLFTN